MNKFKLLNATIVLIFLIFPSIKQTYASPKVTQAAIVDFKTNYITVLAVEEFDKPPELLCFKERNIIYSTQFSDDVAALDEFAYTNSFLRFKAFQIKGLPNPFLLAVVTSPRCSDIVFEIKIIGENSDKIVSLNPEPISLTIQDGIFLGYINKKYGCGMIIWRFEWDDAHYSPHRYSISIYSWDDKIKSFLLNKRFITHKKFKDGGSALKYYGLPFRNMRKEVSDGKDNISTLGMENEFLQYRTNNNRE